MGNPFNQTKTTTQTTTPFSGDWAKRATGVYNSLYNKANDSTDNTYTSSLTSDAGKNYMTNAADSLSENLSNNTTINDMAGGKYLDVKSNPYMSSYLNAGVSKIKDVAMKSYDRTNALFQTRRLPFSSIQQKTLNDQTSDTSGKIDNFMTSTGMQAYNQNSQNMLSANNALNSGYSNLSNMGASQQTLGQNDIATALKAWQAGKTLDQADTTNLLNMLQLAKNPTNTPSSSAVTSSGGWGGSVLGGLLGSIKW